MTILRWLIVAAVVALIAWFYARSTPLPPQSFEDAWGFGPGKNAFDCEKDTPVRPLDPSLSPEQQARVLALLRQACQEPAR